MRIGETMKYISCNQNNPPKILEDDSFILSLEQISRNNKHTPIFHDEMTHLAKKLVIMKELLDQFY